MNCRKQNSTTYPMDFLMVDSTDHITGKTGLTPTVTLSKNGAAFAASVGTVTEIGNGWYSLAANGIDRNTLGELLLHASATGADPYDEKYVIVPWNPFDPNLALTRLDAAVSSVAPPTDYQQRGVEVTLPVSPPTGYGAPTDYQQRDIPVTLPDPPPTGYGGGSGGTSTPSGINPIPVLVYDDEGNMVVDVPHR